MTDDEYEALAQKLGFSSPKALYASQRPDDPLTTPSILGQESAISQTSAGGIRQDVIPAETDRRGARGLTTPGLEEIKTPYAMPGVDSNAILNKAITESIKYHETQLAQSNVVQAQTAAHKAQLAEAVKTLGDLDATDAQKQAAQAIVPGLEGEIRRANETQAARGPNPVISLAQLKQVYPELDDQGLRQAQRGLFLQNINQPDDPSIAKLKSYTNLQTGMSYRALQDLGIQFPGVTGKYSTAPVFKPDAPPPAQKIQRAQPVPGQTVDAQGNVIKAPASSIGLTTVRGTEFGQIDNPARGGYTEQGWNIGAWGGDIAETKTPFVALPTSVLSKYGNPSDSKFADDFNSKYDVQVTDPNTGKTVVATVRDKGPGAKTGAGIDMGWGTREQLGLQPGFSGNIGYRIVPKGSALPDGSTPSVAQTEQAASTATAGGQFTAGATPSSVHFVPVDRKNLRTPWVDKTSMSSAELANWARAQTEDYASAAEDSGVPITRKQWQEQYQKFFEGGQKYTQTPEKAEPQKPIPDQWNNQFNALAALVSPTATPEGSQLDLLAKYFGPAKRTSGTGMSEVPGFPNPDVQMFKSQRQHLLTPIAIGLMSMTPGDAGNENVVKEIQKVLPGEWDTEDKDGKPGTASQKLANIRASVRDQMRRIIQIAKGEHHDTTALEEQYRNIFVNSPAAAQQAADAQSFDKLHAKNVANQSQQLNPAQAKAKAESTALKNPPPQF